MELIYARWLGWCTRIALGVLVVTFILYMLGLQAPLISLERLPQVWSLPVGEFLAATGAPTGWRWLRLAGTGDYANLIGVAMLGVVTVLCYLRVLPLLVRSGERAFAVLATAQIVVLLVAASGVAAILLGGNH
jgi:hypothetical protein